MFRGSDLKSAVKGTVNEIKRNFKSPSIKRLQCPIYSGTIKALFDQIWIRYFCLYYLFSFVVSIQKWFENFFLLRNHGEIININHFSSQRNDLIFHIFIRLRFKGYHGKSGIVIIAWGVTYNYEYSPFKPTDNWCSTLQETIFKPRLNH